jgi:hypothetical protein
MGPFKGGVLRNLIFAMFIILTFAVSSLSQDSYNGYGAPDSSYQSTDNALDDSDNSGSHNSIDKGDFRNAYWGMTKDQVRQVETLPPATAAQRMADSSGDNVLCYKGGQIADFSTYFEYGFEGDTLIKAVYDFTVGHDNDNDWFDDFDKIKQVIDEAYWPADYDEITWIKDTYKDDQANWGYAIRIGDADKTAQWYGDRTSISLELFGQNGKMHMSLYYDDDRAADDSTSDDGSD